MAATAASIQKAAALFPVYAPAHGDIPDLDMELLEEYALDDDMNLDFLDGTNISDTSKDTAPNNISDFDDMEDAGSERASATSGGGGGGGGGGSARTTKKRKAGPRKKSEEQMERRRERNRVLARRTRLRKKFFFESLQKQILALKRENTALKDIVKTQMSDAAPELLRKCTASIPSIVTESMAEASTLLDRSDFNLVKALQMAQQSFVVTDPSLPDNPIVFASQGFIEITGYRMDQVLGRNCRFLQGPDTDPKKVTQIREAVSKGSDASVCLLNYRADGSPFWNQFFVAPLRDLNDNVVYFVGAQCVIDKPIDEDYDDEEEEEEEEEVKGKGKGKKAK